MVALSLYPPPPFEVVFLKLWSMDHQHAGYQAHSSSQNQAIWQYDPGMCILVSFLHGYLYQILETPSKFTSPFVQGVILFLHICVVNPYL